jgi:hypothetical protein
MPVRHPVRIEEIRTDIRDIPRDNPEPFRPRQNPEFVFDPGIVEDRDNAARQLYSHRINENRNTPFEDGVIPHLPQEHIANTRVYDDVIATVQAALDECQDMVPGNSVLAKAGAKIPLAAKYSGSSRPEEFEVYVASLLRWMRVNCLLGVDSTQDQLAILGMTLEGPAQEWFVQNIERGGRSTRGWTLVTAIKRLHDRFLPTATKHEVAYKFDRVRQHGRTVHDFVNELLKLSQRLAYPPDDYTFRRRFVDGLDDEIAGEITKRGYMAENTTARDLYRAANDVEQALSYQRSAAG